VILGRSHLYLIRAPYHRSTCAATPVRLASPVRIDHSIQKGPSGEARLPCYRKLRWNLALSLGPRGMRFGESDEAPPTSEDRSDGAIESWTGAI
jgi:hypothetical protein